MDSFHQSMNLNSSHRSQNNPSYFQHTGNQNNQDRTPGFNASTSSLHSSHLQNMQEPTFYIPRMPEIIKVREPLPPKKPVQPAHDAKTLRKQLEFLQEDIKERTENYNAICYQNEQLWHYIQELLEANKGNAVKMKDYVRNLNDELRVVYRERMQYAEKLEMAKSSQQMLLDLNRELQESQVSNEEIVKRRKEAQNELMKAKYEREELEHILKEKVEQMENYENLLNEFRMKKYEDETIEQADEFFFSNKIILKAAYHRFRQGVKKRLKEQKIFDLFHSFYLKFLKKKFFEIWFYYLRIQQFTKSSQRKRNLECELLFFTKWKVYKALEMLFQKSNRKFLLSTTFHSWILYIQQCQQEKQNLLKLQSYQLLQEKKLIFHRWKSSICFLSWYDPIILQKEEQAKQYFLFKLFKAWLLQTQQQKQLLSYQLHTIQIIQLKTHFSLWYQLCHRVWKLRGKLLRKFFLNLKQVLGNKSFFMKQKRYAQNYYITKLKKNSWKTYRLWYLNKKKFQKIESKKTTRLLTEHRISLLRQSISFLRKNSILSKRQYLCEKLSQQFYREKYLLYGLQQLKRNLHNKHLCKEFFMKKKCSLFFMKLKKSISLTKFHTRNFHKTKLFSKQIMKLKLINSLRKWFYYLHFLKQRKMIIKIISHKANRRKFYVAWKIWKSTFAKVIFWKMRNLEIEKQRIQSLNDVMKQQLQSLTLEISDLKSIQKDQENTIIHLTELIDGKNSLLNENLLKIQQYESNKISLEHFVTELTNNLDRLEKEKLQWKIIEDNYTQEKLKETNEREKKRQETLQKIHKLQSDNSYLQQNILSFTNQSQKKTLENDSLISYYSSLIDEKEKEKHDTLASIQSSEMELKSLESDEESLNIELNKVQKKMKEISQESENIFKDNTKQLREKTSEVRILREDAGLAQARVGALYEIASDYKAERGKMDLSEIIENEKRELESLQSKREEAEQQQQSFLTPVKGGTLESKDSTPSSVSSELVAVDQSFRDARDTIRMLTQRLSSSTSVNGPPVRGTKN